MKKTKKTARFDAQREFVDRVKEQTDIVELIGETISLKRSGSSFVGRSLKNRDTDPSLSVSPSLQIWKDWSGGGTAGGDCFDFIEYRDNCSFKEALDLLALRAGVSRPDQSPEELRVQLELAQERRLVERIYADASKYLHGTLTSEARERFLHRHYGFDDQIIDRLQLGFDDGSLFQHLTEGLGYSQEECLLSGLFSRKGNGRIEDYFKHRITIPYWYRGKVVYFAGRTTTLLGEPQSQSAKVPRKYLKLQMNSSGAPYISVTVRNEYLFNQDDLHCDGDLLVAEGYPDCISAMQAGLSCVSPATTTFRSEDFERIAAKRKRGSVVRICFDNEAKRAGELGAIAAATRLQELGVDVRHIILPRPVGRDRIDLNEFLGEHGAQSFKPLYESAVRHIEFLIAQIPRETDHLDLTPQLAPILAAVSKCCEIEQDAYLRTIATRFKLRLLSLKKQFKAAHVATVQAKESMTNQTPTTSCKFRGEVRQSNGCYVIDGPRDTALVISSFFIRPTRLITCQDGDVVEATVVTERGEELQGFRFPRASWNSRASFLRALDSTALQWTGTDDHVQGVLRLISRMQVPRVRGASVVGYFHDGKCPRWVWPGGSIEPANASGPFEPICLVGTATSLGDRMDYPALSSEEERSLAQKLIPELFNLNTPEVIVPIIGWFVAAPLRPVIRKLAGAFPLLSVSGTQGSGKTSLVTEVLWPLLGAKITEPYGVNDTKFAQVRILSSSASFPVVLDEYRPSEMARESRDHLHTLLRSLTGGAVAERGKTDFVNARFDLHAPVCLIGESRPIDGAMLERMIPVCLDKDQLVSNGQSRTAFTKAVELQPRKLAAALIRYLLSSDVEAEWIAAQADLEAMLPSHGLPIRVRKNLSVVMLGVRVFKQFAETLGACLPEVDLSTVFTSLRNELLDGKHNRVKVSLDYFLEELSTLAATGELKAGNHYHLSTDGQYAINFPACYKVASEHVRRGNNEINIGDRKSLRRQLRESHKRGGYVKALGAYCAYTNLNHAKGEMRVDVIDFEQARRELDIDPLPWPAALEPAKVYIKNSESPTQPSHKTPSCVSVAGRDGSTRKKQRP